jgi:hypothetical protein
MEADGQLPCGFKQDSAAGQVDGISGPRFQYAPPPDELPAEIQLDRVTFSGAAVAGDSVRPACLP